jgi:hypothetical protein
MAAMLPSVTHFVPRGNLESLNCNLSPFATGATGNGLNRLLFLTLTYSLLLTSALVSYCVLA